MGYYVNLIDHNAYIAKEDFDEAYKCLCALNDTNDYKSGGSWPRPESNEPNPNIWFSWMPWNYPDLCKNAFEIFDMLGFELEENLDGNLCLYGYDDKTGAEQIFLNSVSHLWKPFDKNDYPFHAWRGEEGSMWRVAYINGAPVDQSAVISWR